MSNYSNTKATIAANVYTNHNNKVTAEMVKAGINAVVDTLIAGGFICKGVATTSTNPGSPDANVFYIATAPGTYTNFGSLVVADGEVAILKYNGSWSKEVTGAATSAQVSALGHEVSENEYLFGFREITGMNIGGAGGTGGSSWSTNTNYSFYLYEVKPGQKVFMTANRANNSVYAFLASYDPSVAPDFASGSATAYLGTGKSAEMTAPANAKFLYVTHKAGASVNRAPEYLTIDGVEAATRIDAEVQDDAAAIENTGAYVALNPDGSVSNRTFDAGKVASGSASYSILYYYFDKETKARVIFNSATAAVTGSLFIASAPGDIVIGYAPAVIYHTSINAGEKYTQYVTIPAGKYLCVSVHENCSYVISAFSNEDIGNEVLGIGENLMLKVIGDFDVPGYPARETGADTISGPFKGYEVDLTGLYPKYKYIYFRGADAGGGSSNIRRGIIYDGNGNVESFVPLVSVYTNGWQTLPLTANSAKLRATFVRPSTGFGDVWSPTYVVAQNIPESYAELITRDYQLDELAVPKTIHAVLGERVLLFKNALLPKGVDEMFLNCEGGRNFRRYLMVIPDSAGDKSFTAEYEGVTKTGKLSVVSPNNPASKKNVLVVGASSTANYATIFEELYRRLALTTGNADITQFGKTIKDPTNPRGLGLTNVAFVGRKSNGEHFNYEATGGYSWRNYYGTSSYYNYAFTVADTTGFYLNDVYTDGTHNFTIKEISAADHRISAHATTPNISLPASGSLSKSSGSGSASLVYSAYEDTLTQPFLNPNTLATSLQYYMSTYCNNESLDIVYFNGLIFNLAFNFSVLESHAKPLARVIHTEYPSAKIIFGTGAYADTGGYGEAYLYANDLLGQTAWCNKQIREYLKQLETMCDELNAEFGADVCCVSYMALQTDSDHDYPLISAPVNNRDTTDTEPMGTNGIHPTATGILNHIDAIYRSICYVVAKFFN
jgi:hypothetical protein